MELQRTMRKFDFERNMHERCLERLRESLANATDHFFQKAITRRINEIEEAQVVNIDEYDTASNAIDRLRSDETSREAYSLLSFEQNMFKNKKLLEDIAVEYQSTLLAAEKGHRLSELTLPEVRDRLTIQKLQINELESQFKLLQSQGK